MSGRCWCSKRLETPLRLFTSAATATLGRYSTSRAHGRLRRPSSPAQPARPSRRRRRCRGGRRSHVRRTHGGDTLIRRFNAHITRKTQSLLLRIYLSSLIDQPYHRFVKRFQAFKFELRPDGAQRRQMRCFAGACRFPPSIGIQAVVERRFSHPRAAAEHQQKMSAMRSCLGREPADTTAVPLHCMRFGGERRSGRRDQHSQGGTRPLRL